MISNLLISNANESSSLSPESTTTSSSSNSTFSSSYQTLNPHENDPMVMRMNNNNTKSKECNISVKNNNDNNNSIQLEHRNDSSFSYLAANPAFYAATTAAETGFYHNLGYTYNHTQDYNNQSYDNEGGTKQEYEKQQAQPLVNYYNNCKSETRFY